MKIIYLITLGKNKKIKVEKILCESKKLNTENIYRILNEKINDEYEAYLLGKKIGKEI